MGGNGAGKTTILKMLNGLIKPDRGEITVRGRVGALIALGAGFNPILTGRENIYINGTVLGMSRREISARFDEIIDFADVAEFVDTPVQNYSSGMQVRLGFSIAAHLNPDIMLVDEVLAVGDGRFRQMCFNKLNELRKEGSSFVIVSHNLTDLMQSANRGIVLRKGRMVADESIADAITAYQSMDGAQTNDTYDHKDLRITDVHIDYAQQREFASTFEDVDIVVDVNTSLPEKDVGLFISVYDPAGTTIATLSNVDTGQALKLTQGDNQLRVTLSNIPLVFGSYKIGVSLRDPSLNEFLDHRYSTRSLVVKNASSRIQGRVNTELFALKSNWKSN